jgi:thymidylate synthase ThyX
VTNLDRPVFALVNLPETVKGALFARYSRYQGTLRRLFLDEFADSLPAGGARDGDAEGARAAELYERIFLGYGDDSVAQLGGVHLACEQASNLLTKVLERGRLMSYLEQSTRYIAYDARIGGRYRYHRDPEVLGSHLGLRYVGDLDRLFDTYAEMAATMTEFFRDRFPKDPADSDFIYRQALKAKALDSVRGALPAASLSNVGIYGTGQAYEALLLRMRAHPLPEARNYADLMLTELRKVIPSFLKRVDLTDRGVAASTYLAGTRMHMEELAGRLFPDAAGGDEAPGVRLVDFDPDAEVKLVASMLYPYTQLSDAEIETRVRAMSVDERLAVVRTYVGDRSNRRHRPGRAFERPGYRFDVLADYGAFRDLQRHRLLTIEWQPLSPRHGYTRPEAVDLAGLTATFDEAMERSASLHDALADRFPVQAPYAVSLAYRIRFVMEMNAREAMHLIELRTTPQGHPAYRVVAQQMHRLIAEQAGHRAVAEAMRFADHSPEPELERLASERRAERRRASR